MPNSQIASVYKSSETKVKNGTEFDIAQLLFKKLLKKLVTKYFDYIMIRLQILRSTNSSMVASRIWMQQKMKKTIPFVVS